MKKIELIRFLLDEAEKEIAAIEQYKKDIYDAYQKADAESEETGKRVHYSKFFKYPERMPKKSRVSANLLKIRQLSIEVCKEIRPC